jgi:hypothetical protein
MTPRAEVRTLDRQGLADFIQELKREKCRHQTPLDAKFRARFAKAVNKLPKAKRVTEEVGYARHIENTVAAWEAKQAKTVEEAKVPAKPEPESADLLGAATASMFAGQIADLNARCLANTFRSVGFYVGQLNRDVNANRVDGYAKDIAAGKWWFTPDPIVVTDTGEIINGQHRLLAVEQTVGRADFDAPAPQFVVVWNVDKEAAILMDESRRSSTDRRDIAMRYAAARS